MKIAQRTSGQGCSFCKLNKTCPHNNLTITHPELCKEWDFEKNEKGPENYTFGSGFKVSWICSINPCGCHKYDDFIFRRTSGGKCSYCSINKVCKHNNLTITHPELCKEWDFGKNEKGPENYTFGSHAKVFWVCPINPCGCHKYNSSILERTNGHGCSFCNNGKACPHYNLLIDNFELCQEWDNDKNDLSPINYSPHSSTSIWWKCKINSSHKWDARILDRNRVNPGGCPFCMKHGYSKISLEWFNYIMNKENINIQHAENGGEYFIYGVGKVDGYCKETNTVYEFHGDYYHGNPIRFNSEDINPTNHKTYGELYSKTLLRDKLIISKSYKLIIMWEYDFKEFKKNNICLFK